MIKGESTKVKGSQHELEVCHKGTEQDNFSQANDGG